VFGGIELDLVQAEIEGDTQYCISTRFWRRGASCSGHLGGFVRGTRISGVFGFDATNGHRPIRRTAQNAGDSRGSGVWAAWKFATDATRHPHGKPSSQRITEIRIRIFVAANGRVLSFFCSQ